MGKACKVTSCASPPTARGWCGAHYQRWRRFGDAEFVPEIRRRTCTVGGCGKVHNARGLCGIHYYRWLRYGDPLKSKNKDRGPTPVAIQAPRPCVTCGRVYEPGRSVRRKYCGKACKPNRNAGSVNRRDWVERLAARDGWRCWLCDHTIDPALYWPLSMAGSVDHVVPISRGGTDEGKNLRLAHVQCNTARGVKDFVVVDGQFRMTI